MFSAVFLVSTLAAFASGDSGSTAGNYYDFIPSDAFGGVAVRSLDELQKKGDKLIEKAEWKNPARISDGIQFLLNHLQITDGFDKDGAAGAYIANPNNAKEEDTGGILGVLNLFVVVIPFTDRDEIGKNFGFKKGQLETDKVVTLKDPQSPVQFVYVRGKHLYCANRKGALNEIQKAKSIGNLLGAEQQRELGKSDVFLQLGPDLWKMFWTEMWGRNPEGAKQGETGRELYDALGTMRGFLGGLFLHEDGVRLSLVNLFDGKNESAKKVLGRLRAGKDGSLHGLPEGRVIAAESAGLDGKESVAVVRELLQLVLDLTARENEKLISSVDRATYLGVFGEIWKNMQGHRLALYQSSDELKHGLFGTVAILDSENPKKFIEDLRHLMKWGDPKSLKLGKDGVKEDIAAVNGWIRDLGDENFEKRDAATTKLTLIGEPVLPHIEKALNSDDLEVRKRAEQIKQEIVASVEQRRKELLNEKLPQPVRPSFTFFANAQTVHGVSVDIIEMKFTGGDADLTKRIRNFFGPDWDKIRLAVVGKHIVVFLGSDEQLFQTAVSNVKENRPGLAGVKAQQDFARGAGKGGRIELHAAMGTILTLAAAEDLKNPPDKKTPPALTSLAVRVEEDRLIVELWAPLPELKLILENLRF